MRPRIFLTMLLSVGSLGTFAPAPSLYAQQPMQGAQRLEEVAANLQLSPQQKRQLMPILAAEAPKVKAIRNDASLSRMEKLRQLRALHAQTDPQVKAILTPSQYQSLQEIRRNEISQAIRSRQGE